MRFWYLPQKFLKQLLKPQGYIALCQKSISQALVAISKIIVKWAASCISYKLQYVYTVRRARWYVTGREWKIDNVEVKIIAFVMASWKFISTFLWWMWHQGNLLSYNYTIRFIGYDSIQTRWFISYRFQIRTITWHQYKRIGAINRTV